MLECEHPFRFTVNVVVSELDPPFTMNEIDPIDNSGEDTLNILCLGNKIQIKFVASAIVGFIAAQGGDVGRLSGGGGYDVLLGRTFTVTV